MQYKTGIICNSQWLFSLSFSSSVYGCVLFFLCLCGCLFLSHFFYFCFDSRAFAQVLWNQLVHIHLLGIVVAYIFGIFNKQTNVYNTHFACSYNFASLNCCRCYCCRNIIRSFIRFYVECVFFSCLHLFFSVAVFVIVFGWHRKFSIWKNATHLYCFHHFILGKLIKMSH